MNPRAHNKDLDIGVVSCSKKKKGYWGGDVSLFYTDNFNQEEISPCLVPYYHLEEALHGGDPLCKLSDTCVLCDPVEAL